MRTLGGLPNSVYQLKIEPILVTSYNLKFIQLDLTCNHDSYMGIPTNNGEYAG
jgi:hypothetical protein